MHITQVGQKVLAIGNPFGLDQTLTVGIVSGTGREIKGVGGRPIQVWVGWSEGGSFDKINGFEQQGLLVSSFGPHMLRMSSRLMPQSIRGIGMYRNRLGPRVDIG